MKLLAIDTSTELASVALAVDGNAYCEEQGSMREHAQHLLPMVLRLLQKAHLTCRQLDAIVFGRGPGSFTGLRIACSVAKGLAYAHDLPLYPVSSLAAIASVAMQQNQGADVLAMMDARMQQVYWGYFSDTCYDAEEHVSATADVVVPAKRSYVLAGVGFEPYLPQLPVAIQTNIMKQETIFPNANAMIRLVESGHIHAVNASEALPVYVRNQVTQGGSHG